MSTAKEICEGVPRSLLDSPVSDIHLSDIASHIIEWRELAPYLELSGVARPGDLVGHEHGKRSFAA